MTPGKPRIGFFRRFARDRRAVGAVEFVLIAPVLLLLYVGGSELSMFLTLHRKVQHATSTINDLITQSANVDPRGIDGIYNAAKAIISPYKLTPLKIVTTAVFIDGNGNATALWSYSNDPVLKVPKGSPVQMPVSFKDVRNQQIVKVATRYDYVPFVGSSVLSPRDIGSISYLNPRNGDAVECPACP